MKIAIDSSGLSKGNSIRGIGKYTSNLFNELKKVNKVDGNKFTVETIDQNDISFSDIKKRFDLVHYPYFDLFQNTLPTKSSIPVVVTVHDVIPLLYPKHYVVGVRAKMNLDRQKRALRKVNAVITDSNTSKKDIIRFLGIDPSLVHTVYLGASNLVYKVEGKKKLSDIKQKYKLPDKFVLYVGDVNYNKNIPVLIQACKQAGIKLVIGGKQALEIDEMIRSYQVQGPRDVVRKFFNKLHPELQHLRELSKNLDGSDLVIRLGYIPDEDIAGIYNLATVYCQPSLYEGFGLPLLEAFACHTPVIASRTQTLVEVGGDACIYADPYDYTDFAEKIKNVVSDSKLADELVKKGITRLAFFSWKKAAEDTIAVYRNILHK